MTRKKKPPPQSKRHAVTDNSGWTHITKGPKSTVNTQHTKRLLQQEKIRRESLSLEAYSDKFEKYYTPKWRESSCLRNLESILEQDVLSANNTITITRCVCLGLGSPTAGVEVSSWELAAFISILEILGTKHQIQEAIFQDPVFNATDHAFLKDRGYTIVEDPSAFSMIDDTTFLFAPHLEWVHLATALEGANPSLCGCGDIDGFISDESIATKTSEDVHRVLRDYTDKMTWKAMPDFDGGHNWCFFLCIYWLRGQEGVEDDENMEQRTMTALEDLRL